MPLGNLFSADNAFFQGIDKMANASNPLLSQSDMHPALKLLSSINVQTPNFSFSGGGGGNQMQNAMLQKLLADTGAGGGGAARTATIGGSQPPRMVNPIPVTPMGPAQTLSMFR